MFDRFGVELEYMIVDRDSLDVRPVSDELIRSACGEIRSDVEFEDVTWSNELVLHVIELKTTQPASTLHRLDEAFQAHVRKINRLLAPAGAMLLPTSMHPWMDPFTQTRLWPHDYGEVYAAFNRIFDCRGHGWSNLQCVHLNLPFDGDEEFGRLHAAVRLVLPLLPALAASSPVVDGAATGLMDTRLEVYRHNARRVPSVSGRVIPEPVYTIADYEQTILQRTYDDLAPLDPDGVLRDEWVNARGAIARFCRNTIEIRVLDIQECPSADLAILQLIVAVLRGLFEERTASWSQQRAWEVDPLAQVFESTLRDAERAVVGNAEYLRTLGLPPRAGMTAGECWRILLDRHGASLDAAAGRQLDALLSGGTLARRIVQDLGEPASRQRLESTYRRLGRCLEAGERFVPGVE